MDFFGMGFGEVILILLIALIILGPGKIVDFGRNLGKLVYNVRKATSEITTQITKEIEEEKKATSDLTTQITKDIQEQKKVVSEMTTQITREIEEQEKSDSTEEKKKPASGS